MNPAIPTPLNSTIAMVDIHIKGDGDLVDCVVIRPSFWSGLFSDSYMPVA
jgi:hypothetical protein